MTIRITGLNSGLDTDSLVKELVSAYSVKKDNYVKAQTKLSWTQSAWKALNTKIYSLYSNISSLRYTSAYTLKSATVSDTTKATVTAANGAINGSYTLSISQVAKSGYLTGGQLASTTTSSTTLSALGYDSGDTNISVTSGSTTTNITVNGSTTVSDFVSKLNSAGVKASYDSTNQRIYVSASATGASNDFSLSGATANGTSVLNTLGLNAQSTANTATYTAWAAYSQYTSEELQEFLDEVEAANTSNTDAKSSSKTASAKITADNTLVFYANAYKGVQDAISSLDDTQKKDILKLGAMSSTELQKTYETDEDGNLKYDENGKLIQATESSEYSVKGADKLTALEKTAGMITTTETTAEDGTVTTTTDSTNASSFISSLKLVNTYEANTANAANVTDVHNRYDGTEDAGTITDLTTSLVDDIAEQQALITSNNATITANNAVIAQYALISTGETADELKARADYAQSIVDGTTTVEYSSGATRVDGQDSIIKLNGASYTSASNTYTINGLTINTLSTTDSDLTIAVNTDTDGIYDKIKSFITQYNSLINEMTSLYNADSSKGYEPLTSDEKDAMTDTEIEEWETKIKSSLLRRDGTLDGVMNVMESAMATSYKVNGKTYSLSSFGIATLGILNASDNEQNAYHIAGDADDSASSGKTDKLKTAITNDPDSVIEYMKQLTTGLYDALDGKMKSTSLSSAYTVYNDKQMDKEYSDYTDTIEKWEDKVTDMEDYYYNKFTAMESALATLQSNASSLSSLLG